MGKKIYKLNTIKYWLCYSVEELASLCGVHKQTVRKWINKQGLKTLEGKGLTLIYGNNAKIFLKQQNDSNKNKTEFDEFYCMKCHQCRKPLKKQIKVSLRENTALQVEALCCEPKCKTRMFKLYKFDDHTKLMRLFKEVDNLRLYDSKDSPLKTHFSNPEKDSLNESKQTELF